MLFSSQRPVRGASGRGAAAALLLFLLVPSIHAMGARESDAQKPSSREARDYARGPYGTAEAPTGSWSLTLPDRAESAPAEAESQEPAPSERPVVRLTVDEAVNLAREGNLGLAGPRIEAAGKKRASDLAWNNFLPTVDASGTLARWNKEQSTYVLLPGPSLASVTLPDWSLSSSLSVQLALNMALFEGVKALRADYESGLISYAQAEARLERDVRKSFFGLLLAQANIRLMEEQIDAARRRYEQTQANYLAGGTSELNALQARVAWENLKPALTEIRIGYEAARDAFAMTLGLPRGTVVETSGEIRPVSAELDSRKLVETGLSSRLDVQSLIKTLETLEIQETALKYQLWTPNLILGWNADPTFQGDPWKDDLFGKDMWSQSSGMFRLTLSLRLNGFFPFSQEAQQLKSLQDQKEILRASLAMALRGAETEIDSLVRQLDKSRDSRAALTLNVELADRAYRLSEQAYRAGAADLLDVQNAELELRKARLELLKEDYTYVTSLLDLEYAVGARFGTLGGSK